VTLAVREVKADQVGKVPGDWPVRGFDLPPGAHQAFLQFSVSDTGLGIAENDMGKLFKAFSQIDSSLARKFEGTGLGLAMVKQLADLHGGSVAVASRAGLGARFVVWLPLRRATRLEGPWPIS
jgi:signal transduction histidine kinase